MTTNCISDKSKSHSEFVQMPHIQNKDFIPLLKEKSIIVVLELRSTYHDKLLIGLNLKKTYNHQSSDFKRTKFSREGNL